MGRLQKKFKGDEQQPPEFKLVVRSDTASSSVEAPLSAPAALASEEEVATSSSLTTTTPTTTKKKTHAWSSARRSIDQILHPHSHQNQRGDDDQHDEHQRRHNRSRSASASSAGTAEDVKTTTTTTNAGALSPTSTARMKNRRRLSQRVLHRLGLGDDDDDDGDGGDGGDGDDKNSHGHRSKADKNDEALLPFSRTGDEEFWERRATMLAGVHDDDDDDDEDHSSQQQEQQQQQEAAPKQEEIASRQTDNDIQEAIRLHEAGKLEQSTAIFARLADPNGANNALSQVLYGLALRHGWGCAPDPEAAVRFLSAAASSAASVEQVALHAGLARGGAAKGELVLAIFELANCFRNGWGVPMDAVAAKQYYETAANLGDTDAMNEAAYCYLKGFGCRKDKLAAARYYRLAEKAGSKTLGNSWIWKEKYDPPTKNKTP
ncbi:hypothetical protein CP532_6895 [Ophiocordyceps camponoti-leonardi (nom. inval.)]|nr:hypothetical protein CP532_6895 [Ophiocordyceps camponoti-leonardi (nom. inval.)]